MVNEPHPEDWPRSFDWDDEPQDYFAKIDGLDWCFLLAICLIVVAFEVVALLATPFFWLSKLGKKP